MTTVPWRLLAPLIALALATPVPADEARAAGATPPTSATLAGFEYLTLLTGGARPGDRLPMVIGLHASGTSPEAMLADFDLIDFPARVVVPRGRHPRPAGTSWFPAGYGDLSPTARARLAFQAMDDLTSFVDAVARAHPTAGRPALLGMSYGGDLGYLIAVHHPDRISAAFPVGARLPAEWLPAGCPCRPDCPLIHAMHGDRDPVVPIDGARSAARQLGALGFRVELHEHPGVGHDFTARMKADFTARFRAALAAQPR